MVPRLDLELCLPGEACVRFSRCPMRLCREDAAGHREIHDRADMLALELADVELPDASDEAQMVVGTPAAVTVQPVRAHVAMGNGLGVGRRRRVGREIVLEPTTDEAEVRVEMRRAVPFTCERRHDVDVLGQKALHRVEEGGVGAELEDRAGAGVARELRVGWLVRVRAEAARNSDAEEDVGAAGEAVALERRLYDDVGARCHGVEGGGRVVVAPKVRDRQTLRGERIDEPLLVGLAAVAKGVDARVLAELDPLARETGAVELGEVAAGEVVRDVGRSEDEGRIVKAHREPGGVTARGRWMSMKMCERLSPCERDAPPELLIARCAEPAAPEAVDVDLDPRRSESARVQDRLERWPISGDELLAPEPEARALWQAEVQRPRDAERSIGMSCPANRFGHAVELGGHGRSGSRPRAPVADMRRRGEEVALLRVAARVRDDQVLEAVVGVA